MGVLNINSREGLNALRNLIASGEVSPDDVDNLTLKGALVSNPMPQQRRSTMPQSVGAGGDAPQPAAKMRVVGVGGGMLTDLGNEPDRPYPVDFARPKINIPGIGSGYYTADGRYAIVDDGSGNKTKVILGYDAAASRLATKQNLELEKARQDIANAEASRALTQEHIRASRVNTPDLFGSGGGEGASPAIGPDGQPVTGETALAGLSPQMATTVKKLAAGEIQFPGGFAMKSPYWQNMLNLVAAYDPGFDQVNYNARAATRKDFVAGKSAVNIKALNTAIAHAGSLEDAYQKVGNGSFPIINRIENWARVNLGDTGRQAAMADTSAKAEALAHELAQVFRQTGMSEGEINAWKQRVDPNSTPAQMKATIDAALELMTGRLQALGASYQQGMGVSKDPLELLSPQARAQWERLTGTAAPSGTSVSARRVPAVGEVRNGWTFTGGDPASPGSWRRQ